jgi:hypothetical protein
MKLSSKVKKYLMRKLICPYVCENVCVKAEKKHREMHNCVLAMVINDIEPYFSNREAEGV